MFPRFDDSNLAHGLCALIVYTEPTHGHSRSLDSEDSVTSAAMDDLGDSTQGFSSRIELRGSYIINV